jgi:hypothetical protein
VAQCHRVVAGHAAQRRTVAGMASRGELAEQCRGFAFDPGACECQCIKSPCRESRYEGSGPVMSSTETETRSRGRSALDRDGTSLEGRPALERGGTSPEGATGPLARRSFTSAASPPSSEAEFRPRVSRPPGWRAVGS